MEHANLLTEIVVLFGMAVVAAWMFRTLKAPSVMGFLFTGVLIGPSGFAFIGEEDVAALAELGLVLLLFIVGLELSPKDLMRTGTSLLVATAGQFLGSAILAAAALMVFGRQALMPSAVLGIGVALSSTAIVLKQLNERGEARSAAGLITTGILLLQDVIVILVMIFLPMFDATGHSDWRMALMKTLGGLAGVAVIALLSRKYLPLLLRHVVQPGGREFLTLFAVLMACGGAYLAGLMNWSMALGSCIAGLLLAGTDVRHQLVADITPFRDVFNALFFISLGMLVNVDAVMPYAHWIVPAIVATLALKILVAAGSVVLAGWPVRPAAAVGVGLCTVSEFGYILGHEAERFNLLDGSILDAFVAYAVGTMMIGALLFPLGETLGGLMTKVLRSRDQKELDQEEHDDHGLCNHLIIVGFGTNGQNLVRALRATGVPHCVIEMNPKLVEMARAAGAPVIVGDATRLAVLHHAGLDEARGMVVAINDPQATRRVVSQARAERQELYVLARTSFIKDLDSLYEVGASEVIPEDFEASIEITAHVLKRFGVPDNAVNDQVNVLRAGRYEMLRGGSTERVAQEDLMKALGASLTTTFFVTEASPACGHSLAELDLRAKTGATVIAVVRGAEPMSNPNPDLRLMSGDTLVLLGTPEQLRLGTLALEG